MYVNHNKSFIMLCMLSSPQLTSHVTDHARSAGSSIYSPDVMASTLVLVSDHNPYP